MIETVLVAVIAAAVTLGGAYLAQKNAPSRKVSDTALIVDSQGKVIGTLRAEIDRVEANLAEELGKRPTRDELLDSNGRLRRQLYDLGETPTNGLKPDISKGSGK